MKKILALTAATLLCIGARAQTIYNPGEHDNLVSVVAQDQSGNLDKFPLEIQLTNPTISIGSVSAYFYIDDNNVRPWVYDEDEEEYAYDINLARGTVKQSTVNLSLTDDDNPTFPGYFYVNVLNSKDFKLNEGTIVTIYIDASKLSAGKHTLHILEPMCSYANADGSESASYFCAPQDIILNVGQGVITVADAIHNVQLSEISEVAYDLQGRRINHPTLHGVTIVGGRKIIR